jgi:hypothetical protein
MIHSVEVTNYQGQTMLMKLTEPNESGFAIREITGIGPAKADVNTSAVVTMDGDIYNSARMTKRNIVLTLVFAGDAEENRHKTYQYFPVKKPLLLTFNTDRRSVRTLGFVESNQPDIFSAQVQTQISVICPDPYFYDADQNFAVATFFGVAPSFEFPFGNESTTVKLLEFGNIVRVTEQNLFYAGDIPAGLTIRARIFGAVGDLTVVNTVTLETLTVSNDRLAATVGAGFTAGDELTITTAPGKKRAQLLRGGLYYNVINALGPVVDWMTVSKGDNLVAFTATSGTDNVQLSIAYDELYEGV